MNKSPGSSPSPLGEFRDFDRAFDRSFVMLAFVMNRHTIDHMLRIGRELMLDDYELFLVWGVLAHQNVAHLLPPGTIPSAVLDDHRGWTIRTTDAGRCVCATSCRSRGFRGSRCGESSKSSPPSSRWSVRRAAGCPAGRGSNPHCAN
jgi:hypothetical protein